MITFNYIIFSHYPSHSSPFLIPLLYNKTEVRSATQLVCFSQFGSVSQNGSVSQLGSMHKLGSHFQLVSISCMGRISQLVSVSRLRIVSHWGRGVFSDFVTSGTEKLNRETLPRTIESQQLIKKTIFNNSYPCSQIFFLPKH